MQVMKRCPICGVRREWGRDGWERHFDGTGASRCTAPVEDAAYNLNSLLLTEKEAAK